MAEKRGRISRGESIAAIVLSILLAVVLLIIPHRFVFGIGGVDTSIFAVDNLSRTQHLVFLLCATGVVRGGYSLYEGRYTLRLTMVTAGAGIADIVLGYILLIRVGILDGQLAESMGLVDERLGLLGRYLPELVFIAIIVGSGADGATYLYRALRYGKGAADKEDLIGYN